MADQEKDKQMQIDDMLDSLLANYSSAEPRVGLETRILANLREAEEKKASQGWWNFKWLWAGMVTAAFIVAAVLNSGRNRVEPTTHVIVKTNQPAPQPEIQPHAPIARQETARVHRRKSSTVPTAQRNAALALNERPAVFPTPTPLSEQEKLVLSYFAGTPREQVIAQSHPDEPPLMEGQDQTEAIPDLMHIPHKVSNTQ
jgi:hypothetical protein